MRLLFALDLKVGTDICDVRRILKFVNTSEYRRDTFIAKLLIQSEISQLGVHRRATLNPNVQTTDEDLYGLARRLAGRWAAKEAAKKAWGASIISWHDLYTEYRPDLYSIVCRSGIDSSDPYNERASGLVTEQAGQLSISHDGDYAVATVLAAPLHSDILIELQRRKAEAESVFKAADAAAANSSSRGVSLGSTDGSTKTTTSAESD